MGLTNFPRGISSFGVPVLPAVSDAVRTGQVLFVCNRTNANGSDGNSGLSPDQPLATVDAAIGLCTASRGDTIYVMPGHAETVTATSIAHDVAGVTIIGLGVGQNRPTFTFGAAAATITVSAANGAWRNCRFVANFADVAAAFTIGAAKAFEVSDSECIDTDATHNFLSIVVTGSTANAADGLTFQRNYVFGLATTTNAVISVLGALDHLLVSDNFADKAATNNAGQFITVAALVIRAARIFRNALNVVGATGATVGIFMTGSSTTNTGMVAYNLVTSLDTSAAILITATLNLAVHENYVSGVVAASGVLWPTADTVS